MKRAIVSDIHGNLEALTAVMTDIASIGVTQIYCLGDIIGYGPNPRECVDAARRFDFCILGNHDQAALFDPEGFSQGAERAIFWTREQLETGGDTDPEVAKRWKFLCELPRTRIEGDWMYVHGSARNPLNEYVFPEDVYNSRKLERIFSIIPKYCLQGHTHVPGVFADDFTFVASADLENSRYRLGQRKLMVNVGSVGQPRDGDPRSSYVVLHDDEVEFRRVPYDFHVTAAKIRGIDSLDNTQADRLSDGR
ncbi:metallophosphatase family protein [Blastopirellula sp. JC732]|uniref:Metallophosphatase family protein n=1 Tax=Blastopirellula sediminis TaxID=2894196 RepID=A0A9X1MKP6_9BACT|nr:metallophosphoesterase family protein [Blastopirellula sediminis]MCC9609527.1 metallophosphatase family protein [Blastopirellula sediminis]MCC9627697.1 metallophosphatase family protein [Blastopirellula sediminis]